MDEVRVKKSEVIVYTLQHENIVCTDQAIMVGDREHDVRGAGENGMDCVGVLFGYGSRAELEEAGAFWIAETVEDLEKYLLSC